MSCLFPIPMNRDSSGNPCPAKHAHTQFYVPCGQCGECRMSRARQWATRCVHEAKNWKMNSFITLTYRKPPPNNSLAPHDTKLFIERLRYQIGKNFKYFLCGEYGDQNDRPHYHAIIFGYDFGWSRRDLFQSPLLLSKQLKQTEISVLAPLNGTEALASTELDEIWGLGHTSVGALTFDSAAYVAQYSMKKINGPSAVKHYGSRHPEFMRTSQNAIGKQFAREYAKEIITHNSVISNGTPQPIPNYYLKQFEKQGLDLTELKQKREEFSQDHSIQKSYVRAQKLDSKFKFKISKADAFRVRYATDRYFDLKETK